MRKNKMMRLASSLLVAVLITTSTISGTFAKYTTNDTAQDSARVAKWGISVEASGNLFGKYYAQNTTIDPATDDKIAVSSTNVASFSPINGVANVVAPGTENEIGFTIDISGKPEVAYDVYADTNSVTTEDIFLKKGKYGVMVEASGLNDATNIVGLYTFDSVNNEYTKVTTGNWVNGTAYYELHDYADVTVDYYYPLVWSVVATGKLNTVEGIITTTTDLKNISSQMVTKISNLAGDANADAAASYKLTWAWPFYVSPANDAADTILGHLMGTLTNGEVVKATGSDDAVFTNQLTDGADYNLEVKFGLGVTVTQVD